ncbi:MAG: hypothetical protein ABH844_02815 [Candidatus Omnitrophota bacterium]
MLSREGIHGIVENVVSSYVAKMDRIEAAADTGEQFLWSFQDSFLDARQEREIVTMELRESLAKISSLRKKDFDNMMKEIVWAQKEKEKEAKSLLNGYITEQKEMAHMLARNLTSVKDDLSKGETKRIKDFQVLIERILSQQDVRKEEVTVKLKQFREEQQVMSKRLKNLLAKGRELRVKDLKSMLEEFKIKKEWRKFSRNTL